MANVCRSFCPLKAKRNAWISPPLLLDFYQSVAFKGDLKRLDVFLVTVNARLYKWWGLSLIYCSLLNNTEWMYCIWGFAHNSSKQDSKCLQEQLLRHRKNEKKPRVLTPLSASCPSLLQIIIFNILTKEQHIRDCLLLIFFYTIIK